MNFKLRIDFSGWMHNIEREKKDSKISLEKKHNSFNFLRQSLRSLCFLKLDQSSRLK